VIGLYWFARGSGDRTSASDAAFLATSFAPKSGQPCPRSRTPGRRASAVTSAQTLDAPWEERASSTFLERKRSDRSSTAPGVSEDAMGATRSDDQSVLLPARVIICSNLTSFSTHVTRQTIYPASHGETPLGGGTSRRVRFRVSARTPLTEPRSRHAGQLRASGVDLRRVGALSRADVSR